MGLGSGIRKKPIPDPGSRVKKAPDPGSGSATLFYFLRLPTSVKYLFSIRMRKEQNIPVSLSHEKEMKLGKLLLRFPEVITR
jgi:hypothetical protein